MADPKLWEELPQLEKPKDHFIAFLDELRVDDIEALYEVETEYDYCRDTARKYRLRHASRSYTTYVEFLNFVIQATSIDEVAEAVETFELKMPDMIVLASQLEETIDARLIK